MQTLATAKPIAFILVRDREKAKAFYSGVLGLTLVSEDNFAAVYDLNGMYSGDSVYSGDSALNCKSSHHPSSPNFGDSAPNCRGGASSFPAKAQAIGRTVTAILPAAPTAPPFPEQRNP